MSRLGWFAAALGLAVIGTLMLHGLGIIIGCALILGAAYPLSKAFSSGKKEKQSASWQMEMGGGQGIEPSLAIQRQTGVMQAPEVPQASAIAPMVSSPVSFTPPPSPPATSEFALGTPPEMPPSQESLSEKEEVSQVSSSVPPVSPLPTLSDASANQQFAGKSVSSIA